MTFKEQAESSRCELLEALEASLRVHYFLDGSEWEAQVFRTKLLPLLCELVLAYEYAIRFQTIISNHGDAPTLTFDEPYMRELFLLDLKDQLELSGLADGTAEDTQIVLSELGKDVLAYLAAYSVRVRNNTLFEIGIEPQKTAIAPDAADRLALKLIDGGAGFKKHQFFEREIGSLGTPVST